MSGAPDAADVPWPEKMNRCEERNDLLLPNRETVAAQELGEADERLERAGEGSHTQAASSSESSLSFT